MDEIILSYFLSSLLVNEGFSIVLICLFLGYVVKHQFPFIKNDYIPLITAVAGAIIAVVAPGFFSGEQVIVSVAKGMALGWASTGMYETIKNLILNRIRSDKSE